MVTPVSMQQLVNAGVDCNTIATIATSTAETVIDRLGQTKLTMVGACNKIGFEQPYPYLTSGQTLNRPTQTVNNAGLLYAPALGTTFPFTTSGAFNTSLWRVISVLDAQKIIDTTQVINVTALRAFSPTSAGQMVSTTGKSTYNDGYNGSYVWDSSSTLTDDGYRVVKVTSLTSGRFILLEKYLARNITALRANTTYKDCLPYTTLYHKLKEIGGGTSYFFDSSSTLADNNGTIIKPDGLAGSGRWIATDKEVTPLQFGALGDSTGRTPSDLGEDISSAIWNTWPAFVTGATYLQQPGHDWGDATFLSTTKPFLNSDTWDYIGCQLALWTMQTVKLPTGSFVLNKPLRYSNSMRNTLYADAMYNSSFTYKNKDSHPTVRGVKLLLDLYRIGGVPTVFRNIGFIGVSGYSPPANVDITGRLSCVGQTNTNGVHFNDCWVAGGVDVGFDLSDYTGDCFITGTTFEFCGAAFAVGTGCDITVSDCNIWQSYAGYVPCGVVVGTGAGSARIDLDNCRVIGYSGRLFSGVLAEINFKGGRIDLIAGGDITIGNKTTLSDTAINVVNQTTTPIQIKSKGVLSNCRIVGTGLTHSLINLGDGINHDTFLCKVTDNTIDVTGTFAEGGYLVSSIVNGAGYLGAATKCLFTSNVVCNQASASIGLDVTNNTTNNMFGI